LQQHIKFDSFFLSQSPDPLACQITGQKYFKDRCNTLSKEANDAYNKLVSVTNLDKADNSNGDSQVQETIQISQSPEVSSFFFSYGFLYDFLCKFENYMFFPTCCMICK
jgi:hypothetical protein